MTVEMRIAGMNWNHNGRDAAPIRVLTTCTGWPEAGPGWVSLRQPLDRAGAIAADCVMIASDDPAAALVDDWASVPLVLALPAGGAVDGALADRADGFVFADDDAGVMADVFVRATSGAPALQVRDLSDGTARTINALSAEASRIADALLRLAEDQRNGEISEQRVDAALIRRILKVRRDRDRYFPAEIFADPAWDMLLDLTAAQLEGKTVPVSSLCIAAAVPTTTALRWIRSLTEAGLFERRIDPADARRTWINLSGDAANAMLAYLRLFGTQFAMR